VKTGENKRGLPASGLLEAWQHREVMSGAFRGDPPGHCPPQARFFGGGGTSPSSKNDRKSGSKKSMSHHRNEDPDIFYRNGGVFRCRLNGLVFIRNFRFPGLRKKSVGDTEKIREIYGR